MHGLLPYVFCVLLFAVGLYAITVKKNLVKVIIGVIIIHNAINLFLILPGYRVPDAGVLRQLGVVGPVVSEAVAPIVTPAMAARGFSPSSPGRLEFIARSVDPVPQALVLTAIVIGLSVVALMVVMAVRLHEKYGTFDLTEIRKLRG